MLQGTGATQTVTPIDQYPLAMALSDCERYYQAGTVASALIGLNKTISNAENNADTAKDQAGPNATQVSQAKATASPVSSNGPLGSITPLTKSSQRIVALPPVRPPTQNDFTLYEKNSLSAADVAAMSQAICAATTTDFGPLNSPTRIAIVKFKAGITNAAAPPLDAQITSKASKPDQSVTGPVATYLRQAVKLYKQNPAATPCSDPNAAFTMGQKAAATLGH